MIILQEWAGLLSLARQPGESLEQLHVFCLAHVLRRPICIYGSVHKFIQFLLNKILIKHIPNVWGLAFPYIVTILTQQH